MKDTFSRFRVTKEQKARIELTKLTPKQLEIAAKASNDELLRLFGLKNHRKWVELVPSLAANWSLDKALTRKDARESFVDGGSMPKTEKRKPEIPDSVFLEEGLTLKNFSERVLTLTGLNRRFRLSKDLVKRVKNKELTREEAFQQTIEAKRKEVVNQ